MDNVCCKGGGSGNATEPKRRCECVNECEIVTFSTSISTNTLSASVILDNITDSSDTARRFVAAMETRHRVEASLMVKTVSLLTSASEVYDRIRNQIDTDIVHEETSWSKSLSKLLTSLGNMMSEHRNVGTYLLWDLNYVYRDYVDYLVTGLSTQLQYVDGLTAEVRGILIRGKSRPISAIEFSRLQQLNDNFQYLNMTLTYFNEMLDKEALQSGGQLFPINLLNGDCEESFSNLNRSVTWNIAWLETFVSNTTDNGTTDDDIYQVAGLRYYIRELSQCLLSYRKELDGFGNQLTTLEFMETFNYELPAMLFDEFNINRAWLAYITKQYMANSLSKLYVSEALHVRGTEMLHTADRLYSDMELSLFSKASDLIDSQEESMISFYSDLLERVTSLQRYMFRNETRIERFMRYFSIWRMPIVDFHAPEVILLLLVCRHITFFVASFALVGFFFDIQSNFN